MVARRTIARTDGPEDSGVSAHPILPEGRGREGRLLQHSARRAHKVPRPSQRTSCPFRFCRTLSPNCRRPGWPVDRGRNRRCRYASGRIQFGLSSCATRAFRYEDRVVLPGEHPEPHRERSAERWMFLWRLNSDLRAVIAELFATFAILSFSNYQLQRFVSQSELV